MSEPSTPSFQGMCHYIGQLSKASKAGIRAALADCPKCHFNMLEGLLHSINCHGKDGAIYVSDLAREIRQPLPAVSRGLRLMEQDGTVVREPDPADRRKTLVRVTPKGYELCHQCEQALRLLCQRAGTVRAGAGSPDGRAARRADGCHSCGKCRAQH